VACVSARDFRWERGDIKSTSLLGNVLARQISYDRDALETIMFRNGFLTEAAASNVWVVHEGAVLGPPKSEHVLEGIRYELIKELCEECGIAYNLRPIAEGEVNAADEILLSSATKEVLPVTSLDGDAVGHGALRGKPGRSTPGCTRPTSGPSRPSRSEGLAAGAGFASGRTPAYPIDGNDHCHAGHPAEKSLIEYPSRFPDQGDGRQRRGLRARGDRDRPPLRPGPSTPPRSSSGRAAARSTWA
jgi:hypothetical protein